MLVDGVSVVSQRQQGTPVAHGRDAVSNSIVWGAGVPNPTARI
jgi:hypothetical protein